MKKITKIILILTLILCCGCSATETTSNSDVIINMPTDNTVNGYRTEIIESETQNTSSKTESKVTSSKTESNNSETESTQNNVTIQYCGNINSKKFHLSNCGSVETIKEENRLYLSDRAEMISLGYEPCKRCKP